MYSFPNLVPLNARSVERIVKSIRAYPFDRIYAGWWDRVLDHGREGGGATKRGKIYRGDTVGRLGLAVQDPPCSRRRETMRSMVERRRPGLQWIVLSVASGTSLQR